MNTAEIKICAEVHIKKKLIILAVLHALMGDVFCVPSRGNMGACGIEFYHRGWSFKFVILIHLGL